MKKIIVKESSFIISFAYFIIGAIMVYKSFYSLELFGIIGTIILISCGLILSILGLLCIFVRNTFIIRYNEFVIEITYKSLFNKPIKITIEVKDITRISFKKRMFNQRVDIYYGDNKRFSFFYGVINIDFHRYIENLAKQIESAKQ